jgi:hypothetical protein
MDHGDPHRITDLAGLRAVVGELSPMLELKVEPAINDEARAFIGRAPFLVLSTADKDGNLDASPKGDGPGFVLVEDEHTIVIPDRPGNRLVYGHRNVLENPHVGVLFIVPGTNETVRINGRAELTTDPELLQRLTARGKPALLAIRVRVDQCFFHCGKAFLRSQLWQPEAWPTHERISFGRMFVRKVGGDDALAEAIDQSVETDYRDNL